MTVGAEEFDPVTFWNTYVVPSVSLYRENQLSKHLAIHAISQIDIMAEVTAKRLRKSANAYRNDLSGRHPILGIIRDAHDTHKHGLLDRKNAIFISKGQRPTQVQEAGFFVGNFFAGGPPSVYEYLGLRTNNDQSWPINNIINQAVDAWEREHPDLLGSESLSGSD